MNINWMYYDSEGIFLPKVVSGPATWRPREILGYSLLQGRYDFRTQRVDIPTLRRLEQLGAKLDGTISHNSTENPHESEIAKLKSSLIASYREPQPSQDHEWNEITQCWRLKPAIVNAEHRRGVAIQTLEDLDTKEIRAISDVIANLHDENARERLDDIRARKDELRKLL